MSIKDVSSDRIKNILNIRKNQKRVSIPPNSESEKALINLKDLDPKTQKRSDPLTTLENLLHFILIRLNYLDKVEYDFNLILKYHRLLKDVERGNDKTTEIKDIETKFPFLNQFYYIILEFFEFICDLIDFYSFLEPKCFSFRDDVPKEILLNYFDEDVLKNERFTFSLFYIPTSYSDLEPKFSIELKEKTRIVQHKFLTLLLKFLDIYPLPKGKKEINEYFDCLVKNSMNIDIEQPKYKHILSEKNEVNRETLSEYKSFSIKWCKCLRTKSKDQIKYEKVLKMLNPLISLDIHHKSEENHQILKKLVFEFARSYIKAEELLLLEISNENKEKVRFSVKEESEKLLINKMEILES